MRSCIYCGKELGDGELCSCPRASARRAAKNNENKTDTNGEAKGGYYRTGYTQQDGRIKRGWHRFKTKRAERRNRYGNTSRKTLDGALSYVWSFIKSPVDGISNPKDFSLAQMLIISAIQGAIIGMGIYFVATGASRSWFGFLANLIGFGGINGYKMLMHIAASAASGAVGGVVMFFIHSGIFFAINRLIFRSYTSYVSFAQRLVLTNIPFTALAAVGVLFAFFSTTTLMILLICGAVTSFILTYVSLSQEWSAYSESRVLYALILGYFVLFALICSLLRISIIGG